MSQISSELKIDVGLGSDVVNTSSSSLSRAPIFPQVTAGAECATCGPQLVASARRSLCAPSLVAYAGVSSASYRVPVGAVVPVAGVVEYDRVVGAFDFLKLVV